MKYDFTTIYDRHGKDALAVDNMGDGQAPDLPKEGFDAIPMWVADMNFATVPTVQEALTERIKHPLFGYFPPSEEYFDSIIRWQEEIRLPLKSWGIIHACLLNREIRIPFILQKKCSVRCSTSR